MARHYLDHASTSPLRPEAADAVRAWLDSPAGDPGRVHAEGHAVRAVIEEAREQVASLFGVRARQIVFTSGATEAVHAAVWGAVWERPGGAVVCAAVEHSAVRESSARVARVVELGVNGHGRITSDHLAAILRDQPAALVHCQWANHEVGTLQPVPDVVACARRAGVLVHADAAAATGHITITLADDNAPDLVSVSGHKLGGPPGVGALVLRRGLRLEPLLVGSAQERGRRAGMENVPGIVGFGAAAQAIATAGVPPSLTVEHAAAAHAEHAAHAPAAAHAAADPAAARAFTERLAAAVLATPGTVQVGDPVQRVPHIVCFGVEGVEAEPVLLGLDRAGIAAHSGSACSSETLEPSPVLAAIGADPSHSLRLSTGWSTTGEDVDAFAAAFPQVVADLRALSS